MFSSASKSFFLPLLHADWDNEKVGCEIDARQAVTEDGNKAVKIRLRVKDTSVVTWGGNKFNDPLNDSGYLTVSFNDTF